jgi:hypothetical protein
VTPAAVKAALRWDTGKQIAMFSPLAQHLCFHIPSAAFTDQCHSEQFTVTALRRWPRAFEEGSYLLPYIIHDNVHPQAEIVKVVYHWLRPPACFGGFCPTSNITLEDFLSTIQN